MCPRWNFAVIIKNTKSPDGCISNVPHAHDSVNSLPSKPNTYNLKVLKYKGLLLDFHSQIWEGLIITGLASFRGLLSIGCFSASFAEMAMQLLPSRNEQHRAHHMCAGPGEWWKGTG